MGISDLESDYRYFLLKRQANDCPGLQAAYEADPRRGRHKEIYERWRRNKRPLGRRKYWARSSAGVFLNNKFIYGREGMSR
jgi:hypothetical protein